MRREDPDKKVPYLKFHSIFMGREFYHKKTNARIERYEAYSLYLKGFETLHSLTNGTGEVGCRIKEGYDEKFLSSIISRAFL